MKNDDRDDKSMRNGPKTDPAEEPAVQFMRALTDLPDDMILEAAWKEDEGLSDKGRRRWLPIFISAAAAVVIGFISWRIVSGRPRVETESTTENETVNEAAINNGKSSEENDTGKFSESSGKENETEAHTPSGFSTTFPSKGEKEDAQRTESTEPKVTETTESTGNTESTENSESTENTESAKITESAENGKDTSKEDDPEKPNDGRDSADHGEKRNPIFYGPEPDKESDGSKNTGKESGKGSEKEEASDDSDLSKDLNGKKAKKVKDKYEAEIIILNHVDPDHSLMTDRVNGYLDLPDTFGGTLNDHGDGLLHVYATTEEAIEEYKGVLKEYPIVVYHIVEHSYYELRETEAMIREHQSEFGFLKTTVGITYNKVFVDVEANDYERMQELVQGLPVVVRIYGAGEQSQQEASEIPGMYDVPDIME